MVEIDPQGWLIKELDFEKTDEENLFQLEHAACVLGRLSAAEALAKTAKTTPRSPRPWPRPGSASRPRQPGKRCLPSCVMATRSSAGP